ncbi:hypothetical protein AB0D49_29015 [Streptomyces sp. NPDC048290]|uniref:hypothetical protein n=1 Tax=Streptomyces sp. NPDC048290 TaxID=3155811 RepID=UPI0034210B02
MATLRFHLDSTLTPAEVMRVLTDFSPARAETWPTIDAEHFQVHQLGDTWAEVTEGTADAWERVRYEWEPDANTVVITTHDSKVFGPGGGWVFRTTPRGTGSRVDIELERHPSTLKSRMVATILPFAAPVFRKSFKAPLKGI